MAGNVKISQLPIAATMTDSTIVPVVAGGNTQQIDGSAMKIYFTDQLANVAFSGEYSDIANTPVLSNVALSGEYSDLLNTPTALSEFSNDTNFITSATANVISVNSETGAVELDAGDIPFVESVPGDWGNEAANIDNVAEALDYLANAKADLQEFTQELSTGNFFQLPGPYVNEAAAIAAGVQVGSFYYDNGGTVRVVQA